jgi:hypothetical protein
MSYTPTPGVLPAISDSNITQVRYIVPQGLYVL